MNPLPIPRKLIEQGVGIPMRFVHEDDNIGELNILVLPNPSELRALLQGVHGQVGPVGSADLWVSWWETNEEERRKIAGGAPIRLCYIGATQINPTFITVGFGVDDISKGGGN